MGGLVQPNDGLCHLNATGFYTHSTKQDYPSIGFINSLAKEHSVSVIWAVTADKFKLYTHLSNHVQGSSVGIISNDSSNIVDLVRKQYRAITTSIKVKTNATSKAGCEAAIETLNCPSQDCNVPLGTAVEFELKVKMTQCKSQTIMVSPVGLADRLLVEIEPQCDCQCSEIPPRNVCSSRLCNGNGHTQCGVCQCCDGFFGPFCECPPDPTLLPGVDPTSRCQQVKTITTKDNKTVQRVGEICEGRGDCICGQCRCHKTREGVELSGQFCENVSFFNKQNQVAFSRKKKLKKK